MKTFVIVIFNSTLFSTFTVNQRRWNQIDWNKRIESIIQQNYLIYLKISFAYLLWISLTQIFIQNQTNSCTCKRSITRVHLKESRTKRDLLVVILPLYVRVCIPFHREDNFLQGRKKGSSFWREILSFSPYLLTLM